MLQSPSAAPNLANRHWMDCQGCKPSKMLPLEYRLHLRKPRSETGRTIIGASKSRREQWLASLPAEAESAVCKPFLDIPFISTASRTKDMYTRCSFGKHLVVFRHTPYAERPNVGRRPITSAQFQLILGGWKRARRRPPVAKPGARPTRAGLLSFFLTCSAPLVQPALPRSMNA